MYKRQELVPELLKKGHEIYVISRKNINNPRLGTDTNNLKFLKLDLSREVSWENENLLNILRGTDGIINLIGEPIADKKWTVSQKQKIEKSRISTTKFLMKTLREFRINPKVIVNGSAIGYYGTSLSAEFTENSLGGNDFLANLCKKWENAAADKPFYSRLVLSLIHISEPTRPY